MSLDIRGILPSTEDLDAVTADAAQLEVLRDAYLDDPHVEERLVQLLAERWHTRVDEFLVPYWEYQPYSSDPTYEYAVERAIGEEPLRLMAFVATQDRPWPEIVTADYTLANEILAPIWPLDYPGGSGWQVSHYQDGRPAAGVLSTNGLWWRYYTTVSNLNRARAAAVARLLLCEDYLARPVTFSTNVSLVDQDGIEEALRSNPYCMGCHSSIDPIASALFGFWQAGEYNTDEMDHYHPERERLGVSVIGTAPEWYGVPVDGLAEMGSRIAADPRFARCTARSMAELLWRRPVENEDFSRVEQLRDAYLKGGERLKPLIAAVTDTAVYRAGGLNSKGTATQEAQENTLRLMTAPLLASSIEDLTGFRWVERGFDQLDNDSIGYRILGGGVDGSYVTRAQQKPGMTWALTVQRLAEGAAEHVVQQELERGQSRRLLSRVELNSAPGSTEFEEELKGLYWRLYARPASAAWSTAIGELWTSVATA
ncbi:MAG TPA: DUF1585 domain-containing protein, partial [Myxococcota bacterium]|nr:DUF1585 domain-containing protein [Myxococcota bacterium]